MDPAVKASDYIFVMAELAKLRAIALESPLDMFKLCHLMMKTDIRRVMINKARATGHA